MQITSFEKKSFSHCLISLLRDILQTRNLNYHDAVWTNEEPWETLNILNLAIVSPVWITGQALNKPTKIQLRGVTQPESSWLSSIWHIRIIDQSPPIFASTIKVNLSCCTYQWTRNSRHVVPYGWVDESLKPFFVVTQLNLGMLSTTSIPVFNQFIDPILIIIPHWSNCDYGINSNFVSIVIGKCDLEMVV